jgi:hypothetical protein
MFSATVSLEPRSHPSIQQQRNQIGWSIVSDAMRFRREERKSGTKERRRGAAEVEARRKQGERATRSRSSHHRPQSLGPRNLGREYGLFREGGVGAAAREGEIKRVAAGVRGRVPFI